MRWIMLAAAAVVFTAGAAHGQTVFQDWNGNADAQLSGLNLSRALIQERLDNDFYQNPPTYRQTYEWHDNRSIGNMRMQEVVVSESCEGGNTAGCEIRVETDTDAEQQNLHSDVQSQDNTEGDGDQTSQTAVSEDAAVNAEDTQ